MPKNKLTTPIWILKGYDSEADYNKVKGISSEKKSHCAVSSKTLNSKSKTFKVRVCPKCGNDNLKVVIGEVGKWECHKCGWKGEDATQKELTEEEFMKYLDDKGEEVA